MNRLPLRSRTSFPARYGTATLVLLSLVHLLVLPVPCHAAVDRLGRQDEASGRPVPAVLHRIYVPSRDFASILNLRRGMDLRTIDLDELRHLLQADWTRRLKEWKSGSSANDGDTDGPPLAVTGAVYKCTQEGRYLKVRAEYDLRISGKGWMAFEVLGGRHAVVKAEFDGKPALLLDRLPQESESGHSASSNRSPTAERSIDLRQQMVQQAPLGSLRATEDDTTVILLNRATVDTRRRHRLNLVFLVPVTRDGYRLRSGFVALPAPSASLELRLDGDRLDVSVDGSVDKRIRSGKGTYLECRLSPRKRVAFEWFRLAADQPRSGAGAGDGNHTDEASREGTRLTEADSYVEAMVFQELAVGEGRMSARVRVQVTVFRKPMDSLSIRFNPVLVDHVEFLENEAVSRCRVDRTKGRISVEFRQALEGRTVIYFDYFKDTRGQSCFTGIVPEFTVAHANRDTGYIAVRRETSVALEEAVRSPNLAVIPLTALPASLRDSQVDKSILVYRYLKHPANLELKVTRYPDAPVVTTVIDRMTASTLLTLEGKCMTSFDVTLRSRTMNPIVIDPSPCGPGAVVRGALVDDSPATLSKNDDGSYEVSLNGFGSAPGDSHRLSFVVLHETSPLRASGMVRLATPALGPSASVVNWRLWLPSNLVFFDVNGNFTVTGQRGVSGGEAPGPPIPVSGTGAYSAMTVKRKLLPPGTPLQFAAYYLPAWSNRLPAPLFLAGGFFLCHACLAVLLRRDNFDYYLAALLAIGVLAFFFATTALEWTGVIVTGVLLYVLLLAALSVWRTVSWLWHRLRPQRRSKKPLDPIATNIARVAPEVEGGEDDETR